MCASRHHRLENLRLLNEDTEEKCLEPPEAVRSTEGGDNRL